MKLLTSTLLASALFATPALACSWGKTASYDKPEQTASIVETSEEAISTFDPATKPIFEEEAEAVDTETEELPEAE